MSADATTVTRIKIIARFDELGLAVCAAEIQQLTDYLCLLAKWNNRVNLTALPVAETANSAIDRLLAEPIMASRLLCATDGIAVDLGSGGGSPGFPLKIGAPWLRMVLVESRGRKCAFLREVGRFLRLTDVEVANSRFESLKFREDLAGQADLVSLRAVRADESLWETVAGLLKPGGRTFWFGGPDRTDGQPPVSLPTSLVFVSSHSLVSTTIEGGPSRLAILHKQS